MKRLSSFILGMVVGAGLLYGALNYHLIHADDGMHLIPKLESQLSLTYVDIREFTVADWAKHTELAAALMQADRGDLIEDAANDALHNALDNVLGGNR